MRIIAKILATLVLVLGFLMFYFAVSFIVFLFRAGETAWALVFLSFFVILFFFVGLSLYGDNGKLNDNF